MGTPWGHPGDTLGTPWGQHQEEGECAGSGVTPMVIGAPGAAKGETAAAKEEAKKAPLAAAKGGAAAETAAAKEEDAAKEAPMMAPQVIGRGRSVEL